MDDYINLVTAIINLVAAIIAYKGVLDYTLLISAVTMWVVAGFTYFKKSQRR